MQLDILFDERQPEPQSHRMRCRLRLGERVEYPRQQRRRNSAPLVLDLHDHFVGLDGAGDGDACAALGESARVLQKVQEGLAQSDGIAFQASRRERKRERDLLIFWVGSEPDGFDHFAEKLVHLNRLVAQHGFAGTRAHDFLQVVDDRAYVSRLPLQDLNGMRQLVVAWMRLFHEVNGVAHGR